MTKYLIGMHTFSCNAQNTHMYTIYNVCVCTGIGFKSNRK